MAGIAFAALCLVAFAEATVFLDEPDHLTVEVGGRAIFRCDFNQDYDCSVSQWVYSSSQCSHGSFLTIVTCRFVSLLPSIDTSRFFSTFGKSTTLLQINDVQLSDAGYYACRIADLNEFSRCGHLTVVDPPTPQEPPYLWIGIGGLSVTAVGGFLICFMCTRRRVLDNQEDSGTPDGGGQDLSIALDDGYEIPRRDAKQRPTANSECEEMNVAI